MTALALVLLAQDVPPPFEARARIERWERAGDRTVASEARVRVRPGRALEIVEGRSRLVIRADGPSDRFHPAELWLHEWAELRRRFRVTVEREPGEDPLPEAVTGPDGAPREPVRAKARGAARAAGAEEAAEALVFRLVPLDPALRRKLSSIRASADPETLRIRRAVFHFSTQATVMALDGFREAGSADDPAFEFGDSGALKEER